MSYKHAFYSLLVLFVAVCAFGFTQMQAPEVITVVEYRDVPVQVHDVNIYPFRSACGLPVVEEAPEIEWVDEGVELASENDPAEKKEATKTEEITKQYRNRLCEDGNGNSALCEGPSQGPNVGKDAEKGNRNAVQQHSQGK